MVSEYLPENTFYKEYFIEEQEVDKYPFAYLEYEEYNKQLGILSSAYNKVFGMPTRSEIFRKIHEFIQNNGLDWDKLNKVVYAIQYENISSDICYKYIKDMWDDTVSFSDFYHECLKSRDWFDKKRESLQKFKEDYINSIKK